VNQDINRTSSKALPAVVDQGDVDCEVDQTTYAAELIQLTEIGKCITNAEVEQLESFYIEILAKPAHRTDGLYSASKDVE